MKMRKSKGQASIEFLMTYGWAIIVIGIALIVLWQWGVFNPSGKVEASSMGFWGVVPMDVNYRSDGNLSIAFQNNIIDGDLNITSVNVSLGDENSYSSLNAPVSPGSIYVWNLTGGVLSGGTPGTGYTMFVSVSYIDERLGAGTVLQSSGDIHHSIEE